jgi:Fe-S cluster assembly protein SufD
MSEKGMMEAAAEIETYQSHFRRFGEGLGEGTKSWVHPLREAAFSRFSGLGFPKTHMEEWRFTSVARLVSTSFAPGEPTAPEVAADTCKRFALGDWKGTELVFVNGRYAPRLSSVRSLPEGVIAGSLADALETNRDLVEPYLSRQATDAESAFSALNLAFLADGAFIHLPGGCVVEDPIHVLFVTRSVNGPIVSHPRNLIVAGANSQAKIVESYGGIDGQVYFTNAVTQVVAGENAVIDHYKLQRESREAFHVATLEFRQERSANVSNHSLSLGGGLVRNDINSRFEGEGGECTLNGLYVVRGNQHVDHHTVIDHAEPHCSSRELYKGILDDSARAVFNGRVIVRPDAQKTDSKQTNKNLLLSDDALVNTNPQLEINADDVKCAHGATIGQLDAEALFYLRSRGIDEPTARSLLTRGFMSDVTDRIRIDAVRSAIEEILVASLPQG